MKAIVQNNYLKKKLFLLFISAFCISFVSHSQIALINSVSGSVSATNYTFTIPVTSPTDFLLITVTTLDKSISNVTDNGVSTVLGGTANITAGGVTAMYYKNLPSFGTHTIVVLTGGGGPTSIYAGAQAYSNVDYTSPLGTFTTATGSAATAQINVLSAATGDVVVDAIGSTPVALNPNATQTTIYNLTTGTMRHGSSSKLGAAVTNMKWTMPGGVNWGMVGVSLRYLNTLPIELISFKAVRNKSEIRLNWVTASETNNDYFTIEKSSDATNFRKIGQVKASGNSQTLKNYIFIDENIEIDDKTYYYRLLQTDFNGQSKQHKTISVDVAGIEILDLFLNPVDETSSIIIKSPKNQIAYFTITAIDGKKIFYSVEKLVVGNNTIKFDLKSLPQGIYLFCIQNNEEVITKKYCSNK